MFEKDKLYYELDIREQLKTCVITKTVETEPGSLYFIFKDGIRYSLIRVANYFFRCVDIKEINHGT